MGKKIKIKYACGTNTCTTSQCTSVAYPTVKTTSFSFTVSQIIQGALSVLDIVMTALETAMKKLIPGLPDLAMPLPGLDLPGFDLPDFDSLLNSIPAVPTLDAKILKLLTTDVPDFPTLNLGNSQKQCPKVADVANSVAQILG